MNGLFGNSIVNAPVVATIRLDEIEPDTNQPRKHFDKDALKELAATIKEKGLIQPIIVRSNPDSTGYIIIAGERRWRAARINNAETIEAIVRDDLDARAAALIENIQRQNLKPLEEADAVATLLAEAELSQGDLAAMLGMGRASLNQLLKIRALPDDIKQESVVADTPKSILIELSSIKDEPVVRRLWKRYRNSDLTIADIRRVRDAGKNKKGATEELTGINIEERNIRKAIGAIATLVEKPLTDQERSLLVELQQRIQTLLGEQ
ncbi:MAG: ParB/RepB/Spo0J family partition protein [Lamprobacter sp.]|uniref:ParB/RepB/Spo0J family partition protein n=1 Tax=Lamprobacter sp. TaxID=3100796 RepID=UPI002B25DB7B|nr:ParB/RepB/Spo0J family partition protein [Lamprobacter sp.]MEA3639971.1 ParB/RepB/Spo0J family partition protein [Lamprobacter sp.]